jgi:nucleoside-diphosphate-sugar epimerase
VRQSQIILSSGDEENLQATKRTMRIHNGISQRKSGTFLWWALVIAAASSPSSLALAWNTAIVTGASGYVGKAIVHQLLLMVDSGEETGDANVNTIEDQIICLVRPQRVQQEAEYWKNVLLKSSSSPSSPTAAAAYRRGVDIRVLPYDMLDGGVSLKKALQVACTSSQSTETECVVHHVASVFGPTEDHVTTALDNVQGTEAVVRALADFVKEKNNVNDDSDTLLLACKLVVTSSMAAVRATGQEPSNGQYYTEQDWNTLSKLGESWGSSYQWSKTESERRARELCRGLGDIPIVSLCPSFVFGPPHGPIGSSSSSSYSIDLVRQWALGESAVQSRLFVDVRDMAAAQVAAGRRPAANGKRYIVSTQARVPSREIAEWLQQVRRRHDNVDAPEKNKKIHYDADFTGGAIPVGTLEVECTQRLHDELGVKLRPVKDTIVDMAERLLEEQKSL